jgi:hypothetical protein
MRWVRKLSGEMVTVDEITRDEEKEKTNHVEANYPGQAHLSKTLITFKESDKTKDKDMKVLIYQSVNTS